MNEEDKALRRAEVEKGRQTEAIVKRLAPIFEARRQSYLMAWESSKVEEDIAREKLWFMVKALDAVYADLREDVQTGEIAERQLAEEAMKSAN